MPRGRPFRCGPAPRETRNRPVRHSTVCERRAEVPRGVGRCAAGAVRCWIVRRGIAVALRARCGTTSGRCAVDRRAGGARRGGARPVCRPAAPVASPSRRAPVVASQAVPASRPGRAGERRGAAPSVADDEDRPDHAGREDRDLCQNRQPERGEQAVIRDQRRHEGEQPGRHRGEGGPDGRSRRVARRGVSPSSRSIRGIAASVILIAVGRMPVRRGGCVRRVTEILREI